MKCYTEISQVENNNHNTTYLPIITFTYYIIYIINYKSVSIIPLSREFIFLL